MLAAPSAATGHKATVANARSTRSASRKVSNAESTSVIGRRSHTSLASPGAQW
jgi:hypothetical protein